LNIFFGENSVYTEDILAAFPQIPDVGNDMMWNPTSDVFIPTGGFPTIFDAFTGGQHFIYVTDEEYDECENIRKRLQPNSSALKKVQAIEKIRWAGIPILAEGAELLSLDEGLIPNELVIKLRIDNPYQMDEGLPEFTGYPSYRIKFEGVEATEHTTEEQINKELAQINVVPNPYFGYSEYETSQFSNVVKISNLPANCVVTIYSLDGRFIRQYKRNEAGIIQSPPRSNPAIAVTQFAPDIDWNLKNNKGIPVSSGVYLIHVNAPGLGERVIKWFGVNRKFDPTGL
jgi:hypothetical protein